MKRLSGVAAVAMVVGMMGAARAGSSSGGYPYGEYVTQSVRTQQVQRQRELAPVSFDGTITVGGRDYTISEWEAGGSWTKQSNFVDKWYGPDGNKYSGPAEGWETYKRQQSNQAHYEAPMFMVGEWGGVLGLDVSLARRKYTDTIPLDVQDPVSDVLRETITLTVARDDMGVNVIVPLSREEFNSEYHRLDYTSAGLVVAPFYRLLREDIHGLDLNLSANAGYSYSWYDYRHDLDRSAVNPWGMGGFSNPQFASSGMSLGAARRLPFGRLELVVGQEWFWDLTDNGDPDTGPERVDFTTGRLGYYVPVWHRINAGFEIMGSYSDDVPDSADTTTTAGSVCLSYSWTSWSAAISLGRDIDNNGIDETTYGLRLTYAW